MRKELGLEENVKVLVFNFGGQVGHLLCNSISLGHMFLSPPHAAMYYVVILKYLHSLVYCAHLIPQNRAFISSVPVSVAYVSFGIEISECK